ncbi:MAG: FtsX-like permease family protein [Dehalococcoidia bacterium]|nr:FtsX-like permease family protein [Dehalococcoidia bacterium]
METLFGVPMLWLSISLATILGITSLVLISMAMRNRILLKLALRNIPRRRAQTILIVIGLMLSTTIISASLAIGDTVTGSIRGVALDALGHTDLRLRTPLASGDAESAVFADDPDGTAFFVDRYLSSTTLGLAIKVVESDGRIDGVMPQIREVLPVLDMQSQLTESRMTVVGFDTSRQRGFGEIHDLDGQIVKLDSLSDTEVFLNRAAAEELDAVTGDMLQIVSPSGHHTFTTKAIVRNNGLAANDYRTIMSLSAMQRIMERPGQVNRIDLSVTGGITSGVDLAGQAAKDLRVQLTDPLVAQQLFDVLRSPTVIQTLTAYANDTGSGDLSPGDAAKILSLIDELVPGDTHTARHASRIGAILASLSNDDTVEHFIAALGEKVVTASSIANGDASPDTPEQILDALTRPNDGLASISPLVDALSQLNAGDDISRYIEANSVEIPTATVSLLKIAGEALSPQPSFTTSPDAIVTDEFRMLAGDSELAAHILAALDSVNSSGRPGLALAVTALFSTLQILSVDELKGDSLELAELVGNIFLTFFTIFGSFSIIVGLLLIFLVFVMLAAARSTEMGIARAVGAKRRHLIQMFTYEGFAYALGAALIGTVLGILASLVLVKMLAGAIGDEEDTAFAFKYSFTLTSVVAAFSAGMLLTLMTVAISAYRVSRLNIVVAIRDLPQEFVTSDTPPLKTRLLQLAQSILGPFYQAFRALSAGRRGEGAFLPLVLVIILFIPPVWGFRIVWAVFKVFQPYLAIGWPLIVIGAAMAGLGLATNLAAFWSLGISLMLVGIGLFLRGMLRRSGIRESAADRSSYTFIGATVLVFWALPFDALEFITGTLDSNFEMFILSGTWMVASAVWLVMYNADLITRGLEALFSGSPLIKAVLKPAIAYPMTSKFRTGLTLAMFSLVIFTMMVFAILNSIGSDLDETPDRVTGGFDIRAETSINLPVADIGAVISNSENLNASDFDLIVGHTDIPAQARQKGAKEQRFLGLGVRGAEQIYLEETLLEITHFDPIYLPTSTLLDNPTAVSEAIWDALANDPTLAVVSGDMLQSSGGPPIFGKAEFSVEGLSQDEIGPITAFEIEIRQAQGRGAASTRTVIGAIDQFAETSESDGGPMALLITRDDLFTELSGNSLPFTTFRIRLGEEVDAGRVAAAMETVFLDNSMKAIDTLDEIKTGIAQNNAFNKLFQGFMGLGLVVGVASLGVLSFRAVVERRHAIGMMRAIGYKSRMIQIQFLLESIFVTVLGSALGLGLGALISWNIINEISNSRTEITFDIPWLTVMTIVGIVVAASLLATFIPARQAAHIHPSEALRYE